VGPPFNRTGSNFLHSPWWVLGLVYLSIVILYINIYAVPPLTLKLMKEIRLSYFQVGLLTTAFIGALAAGNIIMGVLSDRISPRKIMCVGLFTGFLSSLIFTATSRYSIMLISRVVIGLSCATMTVPCMMYIFSSLPPHRASLGISWHLASVTLGCAVALLITPVLASSYPWQSLVRAYAVTGFCVLILFSGIVKESRSTPVQSSSAGFQMNTSKTSLILVSALLFVIFMQIGGNTTWLAPWLEEKCLLSPIQVGIGAMTFSLMGIPSSLFGGYIFSKKNIAYLTVAGLLLSAVSILYVWLESARFLSLLVVIVFTRWGSYMCVGPLMSITSSVVHSRSKGLALGVANSVCMCGVVVSSFLGGYIIEHTGEYSWLWILCPVSLVLCALGLAPLLRTLHKLP
jgi:predicted MFS family arabinose efflux permease